MGVTIVYLMIWSLCLNVLWMETPHISGLVIPEWEYYLWRHDPAHRYVECTRKYLVERAHEWNWYYLLVDRR